MDQRLRVAIVGAGAIGLYLAWKLSLRGHYVVVFERKKGIEAKACSGLVSKTIEDYVPNLLSLAENHIDACLIHFPHKTIRLNFQPPHFSVSRQKINEQLFQLARSTGTSFVWLTHFDREDFSDAFLGRFDRVIGCDGAYSAVRKALGIADPAMKLGLQTFIADKDNSSAVSVWPVKKGFFWRIPRGDYIEYGIMDDKKTARSNFMRLAKEVGALDRLRGIKSSPIPCGLRIPDNPKITLCGDAAGLTKPWSGGGLLWGFTAADILVKHFPDLERYRIEVKKRFTFEIIKGKIATGLVYFLGNNFPYLLPSRIVYNNDFPPF